MFSTSPFHFIHIHTHNVKEIKGMDPAVKQQQMGTLHTCLSGVVLETELQYCTTAALLSSIPKTKLTFSAAETTFTHTHIYTHKHTFTHTQVCISHLYSWLHTQPKGDPSTPSVQEASSGRRFRMPMAKNLFLVLLDY